MDRLFHRCQTILWVPWKLGMESRPRIACGDVAKQTLVFKRSPRTVTTVAMHDDHVHSRIYFRNSTQSRSWEPVISSCAERICRSIPPAMPTVNT